MQNNSLSYFFVGTMPFQNVLIKFKIYYFTHNNELMQLMTSHDYYCIFVYQKFFIKKEAFLFRKGCFMNESYMTVKEFCDRLQISSSTVYRMIKNGIIPAIKFGRYWKIPRSVFDRLR